MALPFRNHFFSDSAPAARGFHEKANSTHNYTSMLHQSRILKQPCRSTRSARVIRASAAIQASYTYRQGSPQDVEFIKQRLWLESMNPLGIKPENFTVVEDSNGAGVVGFAQLAELPAPNTAEFRSLVVLPEHRGKDIGSALMKHIVGGTSKHLYLTTLRRTIPFYEAAGFRLLQASEVPWYLWFEAAAGTVVARIAAGDELVVMHRPVTTASAGQ